MSTEGTNVQNKKPDCLSCRLIRGLGVIGIGSYLIYQTRYVKGYNRGSLFVFGGCMSALGIINLFDIKLVDDDKLS